MTHLLIDSDRCIGCGLCASVCIRDNISVIGGQAVETDSGVCFDCGHCYAVCPTGSIRLNRYIDSVGREYSGDGSIGYDELISFLEMRRSCRWFTQERVSDEDMGKLIRAAELSPTSMNRQDVEFAIIDDRFDDFMHLLRDILEPLSENYPRIAQFIEYVDGGCTGRNPVTWGGRQLVLAFSSRQYDSFIAMSRIELAAQILGLGGFYNMWIQKADGADHDRLMGFFPGIDSEKHLQAAFVVGHPRVRFRRTIPRDVAKVHRY